MKLNELQPLDEAGKPKFASIEDYARKLYGSSYRKFCEVVDGRLNIKKGVTLAAPELYNNLMPFPFGTVEGDFFVNVRQLKSLENSPVTVNGDFDVARTNITSLDGGPLDVHSTYNISNCSKLKTLEGMPQYDVFEIHAPGCSSLTSLNGITPGFYAANFQECPKITSLVGIGDIIRQIDGFIKFDWENIKEGGLGIVNISGGFELGSLNASNPKHAPFIIISKYIGRKDDIFECQAELIEHGFEEYAKL